MAAWPAHRSGGAPDTAASRSHPVAEHLDGSWLTKISIEQVNPAALSSADRSATPADGGYDEFVARCEAISLAAGKAAGGSPTIVADTIYQPVMDRG